MTESNRAHDTTIPAYRTADCGLIAAPASDEPSALSRAEIAARSVSAPTAAERRRWQVIGLLAVQAPLAEASAESGCALLALSVAVTQALAGAARSTTTPALCLPVAAGREPADGGQQALRRVMTARRGLREWPTAMRQCRKPASGRLQGLTRRPTDPHRTLSGARDVHESTPMRHARAYRRTLTTASHWCIVRPSGNRTGQRTQQLRDNPRIPAGAQTT
jgi:hypothetical protein